MSTHDESQGPPSRVCVRVSQSQLISFCGFGAFRRVACAFSRDHAGPRMQPPEGLHRPLRGDACRLGLPERQLKVAVAFDIYASITPCGCLGIFQAPFLARTAEVFARSASPPRAAGPPEQPLRRARMPPQARAGGQGRRQRVQQCGWRAQSARDRGGWPWYGCLAARRRAPRWPFRGCPWRPPSDARLRPFGRLGSSEAAPIGAGLAWGWCQVVLGPARPVRVPVRPRFGRPRA